MAYSGKNIQLAVGTCYLTTEIKSAPPAAT